MGNFVIIGASGGIGNATAQLLHNAGHNVFGTYHNNLEISNQSSINWIQLSIENIETTDWTSTLPEVIDGVFYAVGKVNLKPFHRLSIQDFIQDLQIQTFGAIQVVQKLLPHLKRSPNASVVFCSSVAANIGFPFHSLIGVSKGALEGLTKSLAAEYAPSVRFNCVAPSITSTKLTEGFINTEEKKLAQAQKHPLKKIGTAEDIANLANFLLNDTSGWITGQILHIDGGISTIK
jgi:NAD(P)-dependent dehydrogenase (short-subunit alcohol dehydrogenase family)